MRPDDDPIPPPILCPRCAYDLSGQAEKRSGDEGTCAECGFSFSWPDLLNPDNAGPDWFCESRPPGRRRYFRTFARALRPGRFFSPADGVRLASPSRTRPRFVFVLLVSLAFLAATALLPAIACIGRAAAVGAPKLGAASAVHAATWLGGDDVLELLLPISTRLGGGWAFSPAPQTLVYAAWIAVAWIALTPLGFLALRQTRRVARVSLTHIARAGAYSAAGALLALTLYLLPIAASVTTTALYWNGLATIDARGRPITGILVIDSISRMGDFLAYMGPLLLLPAIGAWLLYWWYTVTLRYFLLPRPFTVAAVMLLIGLLAATALIFLAAWPGPSEELGYLFFNELA